jgi:hypothetical protein
MQGNLTTSVAPNVIMHIVIQILAWLGEQAAKKAFALFVDWIVGLTRSVLARWKKSQAADLAVLENLSTRATL